MLKRLVIGAGLVCMTFSTQANEVSLIPAGELFCKDGAVCSEKKASKIEEGMLSRTVIKTSASSAKILDRARKICYFYLGKMREKTCSSIGDNSNVMFLIEENSNDGEVVITEPVRKLANANLSSMYMHAKSRGVEELSNPPITKELRELVDNLAHTKDEKNHEQIQQNLVYKLISPSWLKGQAPAHAPLHLGLNAFSASVKSFDGEYAIVTGLRRACIDKKPCKTWEYGEVFRLVSEGGRLWLVPKRQNDDSGYIEIDYADIYFARRD